MWQQIALAAVMILVTTFVHAVVTIVAIHAVERVSPTHRRVWKAWIVSMLVLALFVVALVDAGLWAWAYLVVGALEGVEQAFYFSMVTLTTLGYGEITLEPDWRLLASFEAATGIIMFGWTTALVVTYLQRLSPRASTS